MAEKMFSDTYVPVGDKRPYSVLMSIAAHSVIIAAAIMVPLMASDVVMPPQYAMITFRAAPPLPPPLPPPPSGAPRTPPPDAAPSIPVVAPTGISKEEPVQPGPVAGDQVDLNVGIVTGDAVRGLLAVPLPTPMVEQTPYRLGGNIQPPTKMKDAAPVYPAIARGARVQGIVIIEATIGPTGKVQDARVLRSIPLLDAAALDAVRQWEYTPTRLNGQPIAIVMTVTVNFRLQ